MAGRPKIDLNEKVKQLLAHSSESDHSSLAPITNFEQRLNACFGLIKYVDDHVTHGKFYQAIYDGHKSQLNLMTLGSIVEAFERYLKELAVICVDTIAPYVFDNRFDVFSPTGGNLAAQFLSGSIGRVMCESDTWLSNESVNKRFGQILKSHFSSNPWAQLFPDAKQTSRPEPERTRANTLAILWQIRHSITHNTGVLTLSDARKLTLMSQTVVAGDRQLDPNRHDLTYVKRFLQETSRYVNGKVALRLGELLTERLQHDPSLIEDIQELADRVSNQIQQAIVVDGKTGTV